MGGIVEQNRLALRRALGGAAAARMGAHEPPHDGGGEGKEPDAVPPVVAGIGGEFQERLIDEDGGRQGDAGPGSQVPPGQQPELAIDGLKEFVGHRLIPSPPSPKEGGYFVRHHDKPPR